MIRGYHRRHAHWPPDLPRFRAVRRGRRRSTALPAFSAAPRRRRRGLDQARGPAAARVRREQAAEPRVPRRRGARRRRRHARHERPALVEPLPADGRGRGDGRPRRSTSSCPARRPIRPDPGVRLDELLGATVHQLATADRAERDATVDAGRRGADGGRSPAVRHRRRRSAGCRGATGQVRGRHRARRPGSRRRRRPSTRSFVPSATGGTQAGPGRRNAPSRRHATARSSASSSPGRRPSSGRRSRRQSPTSRRSPARTRATRRHRARRLPARRRLRPADRRRGGGDAPARRGPRASSSTRSTRPRRWPPSSPGHARASSTARPSSSGTPAARPGCSSRSTDGPSGRGLLPGRPPGVAQLHPAGRLEDGAGVDPGPDREQDPDRGHRDDDRQPDLPRARSHRTRPAAGRRTAPTAG